MKTLRRAWLFGVAAFLSIGPCGSATASQEANGATQPTLALEQMEDFLLNGEIGRIREIGVGVTNPRRATVSHRGITHDVQIQTVDISLSEFKPPMGRRELNFKDTYRYNIAGYRVARLLGLDNVPMSVERRVDGQPAAVTWWVDDVLMNESARRRQQQWGPDRSRTAAQIHILRVFDELIGNTDRNGGNVLWTADWTMWMIDHTRAFRLTGVRSPKLLERCERTLLVKLRGLTAENVKASVAGSLNFAEIDALLRRRDQIVQRFEAMIAEKGEAAVLYTFILRGAKPKDTRVLETRFSGHWPDLSPDGHWLADVSYESGRPEVYVQAFAGVARSPRSRTMEALRPPGRGMGANCSTCARAKTSGPSSPSRSKRSRHDRTTSRPTAGDSSSSRRSWMSPQREKIHVVQNWFEDAEGEGAHRAVRREGQWTSGATPPSDRPCGFGIRYGSAAW